MQVWQELSYLMVSANSIWSAQQNHNLTLETLVTQLSLEHLTWSGPLSGGPLSPLLKSSWPIRFVLSIDTCLKPTVCGQASIPTSPGNQWAQLHTGRVQFDGNLRRNSSIFRQIQRPWCSLTSRLRSSPSHCFASIFLCFWSLEEINRRLNWTLKTFHLKVLLEGARTACNVRSKPRISETYSVRYSIQVLKHKAKTFFDSLRNRKISDCWLSMNVLIEKSSTLTPVICCSFARIAAPMMVSSVSALDFVLTKWS